MTTNGPVATVLLFADRPDTSPYRTALNNLGRSHQLFTDPNAFSTAVANANPASTLVVVDVVIPRISLNGVGRFANAGGRTLMQYYGLDTFSALATNFNASVQQVLFTPLPIYHWSGSSFFSGLSSPISMTKRYNLSGQRLQPIAGGQAVAGYANTPTANQAAVVIGHSGRTILNGFFMEEVSGTSDAVRLAQNEIQYLLAVRTVYLSSPTWVGGQFQVMLTGTTGLTYSLRGTSNFVNWTTVTNVILSASPTVITVPAPADWRFYQAVTPPVP